METYMKIFSDFSYSGLNCVTEHSPEAFIPEHPYFQVVGSIWNDHYSTLFQCESFINII